MTLPRVVDLGARAPVPVVNDNTGEVTHYANAYPELTAEPSAAQWAAARAAQANDPQGRPWFPYVPTYTRPGSDEQGNTWAGAPEFPLWLAGVPAFPGALEFFKVQGEDSAAAAIARAGGNPSLEYMTADVPDPKGGGRDYLRTLYVRQGDLWRPLASYHRYEASSWVQFRDADLIPIASVALAVVGGALAQAIGRAVVGTQLAAAYPSLPGLVGNVALQTAASGGDIAAAVQNAALSLVGAQAGALVGGGAIGAATSAATSAALKGGDLKTAVASSLLSYGAKNVDFDSFFSADSAMGADPIQMDVQSFEPTASQVTAFDYGAAMADDYGPPEPASWETVNWSQVIPQNDYTTDRGTWALDMPMYGGESISVDPAPASSFDAGDVLVTLTNAALAVIKVNAAYQATQAPAPRTAVQQGSYVKTPNPNGTVTVRNTQTGATQVTKPEVGTPYVMANGSTIINNGNGTFTTIRPDGTATTSAYTSNASAGFALGDIPPALLYGGLGLGALLLLTRNRS